MRKKSIKRILPSTLPGTWQPQGTAKDAADAVAAAKAAFPAWRAIPWQERVALMRKFADRINERLYEIGAAVSLEVGKNRMEALGDVAETADLILWGCKMMEENHGYIRAMGEDPVDGFISKNQSVLKWCLGSHFSLQFPHCLVRWTCWQCPCGRQHRGHETGI